MCKNFVSTKFEGRLQQPNLLADWNFSFTEMLCQVLNGGETLFCLHGKIKLSLQFLTFVTYENLAALFEMKAKNM